MVSLKIGVGLIAVLLIGGFVADQATKQTLRHIDTQTRTDYIQTVCETDGHCLMQIYRERNECYLNVTFLTFEGLKSGLLLNDAAWPTRSLPVSDAGVYWKSRPCYYNSRNLSMVVSRLS